MEMREMAHTEQYTIREFLTWCLDNIHWRRYSLFSRLFNEGLLWQIRSSLFEWVFDLFLPSLFFSLFSASCRHRLHVLPDVQHHFRELPPTTLLVISTTKKKRERSCCCCCMKEPLFPFLSKDSGPFKMTELKKGKWKEACMHQEAVVWASSII